MPRRKAAAGAEPAPRKKPGPKPGASKALAAAAAAVQVATASVAAAVPAPAEQPTARHSFDSLQRGRRIDLMDEAELRAYARQIGISQRDAEGLTVERLRQNCTAQLYELIDAL